MARTQAAEDAAKKLPMYRTQAEQRLVDREKGDQAISNADHEARRQQKAYGK